LKLVIDEKRVFIAGAFLTDIRMTGGIDSYHILTSPGERATDRFRADHLGGSFINPKPHLFVPRVLIPELFSNR
jgi:hypothetical protein